MAELLMQAQPMDPAVARLTLVMIAAVQFGFGLLFGGLLIGYAIRRKVRIAKGKDPYTFSGVAFGFAGALVLGLMCIGGGAVAAVSTALPLMTPANADVSETD